MKFISGRGKPDGPRAFFTAFCGCILQAVVLGTSNSFPGLLPSIRDDFKKKKNEHPSDALMVLAYALSVGLYPLFGIVCGFSTARFGCRPTCYISVLGILVAVMLTPVAATSFYTVIPLYSFFMAIGLGFVFTPTITAVSTWLDKYVSLGMGILFTGGGLGSCIIPTVAGSLIETFNWRRTMLFLSIFAVIAAFAALFIVPREEPEEEEKVSSSDEQPTVKTSNEAPSNNSVEKAVLSVGEDIDTAYQGEPLHADMSASAVEAPTVNTEKAPIGVFIREIILTRSFLTLFFSFASSTIGFFGTVYIIVQLALEMGKKGTVYSKYPKIEIKAASRLFIFFGVSQIILSPVVGYLACRFTDRYMYTLVLCCNAITTALLCTAHYYWQFAVAMIIVGLAGGSVIWSLTPAMVAKRFYGPNLSLTVSLVMSAASIGGFSGPFIGGLVPPATSGNNYTAVLIIFGVFHLIAAIIVCFGMDDKIGKPVISQGEKQIAKHSNKA